MGGVTVYTNSRRGASFSPAVSRIKFNPASACTCSCASEHSHGLTCGFRKSINSSLDGGFQWEE
jgi:hypothetical protein